jgi:hypothetical protein
MKMAYFIFYFSFNILIWLKWFSSFYLFSKNSYMVSTFSPKSFSMFIIIIQMSHLVVEAFEAHCFSW